MTGPTRVALVVNAHSRTGEASYEAALARLTERFGSVDAHGVADPATLDQVVRTVVASKPELLVLGGGDGTISSTVHHLVGTDVALAVLPLGTANSFARALGLPLDLDGALDVALSPERRRIDLGFIGPHSFAGCAALGIQPQIAQTVPDGLKKVLGRVGYVLWGAWQTTRFRPFRMELEADGRRHRLRVVEVRIANGAFLGGTEVVEDARLDDGMLTVQAVVGVTRKRMMANWILTALHLEARHEVERNFHFRSARLTTRPALPISIDGEVLASTPVDLRCEEDALLVAVPQERET